jgi:nucleotide-binding universal stress UspA family protein
MLSSAHGRHISHPPIATIGVGYNGSSRSAEALAAGRELAAAHGARIRVMEVVCPSPSHYRARLAGELGGRVDVLLHQARERLAHLDGVDGCAVYGIAVDELAAFGEEVDLLVIGLGSCGRAQHPSASTSAYLERHAPCQVLVVPRARPICLETCAPAASGSSRSSRRAQRCGP